MITNATLSTFLTVWLSTAALKRKNYASSSLLPVHEVEPQNGNAWTMDASSCLENVPNVARSPGTPFARVQTRLGTESYACENYGIEQALGREDVIKYGSDGAALMACTMKLAQHLLLAHEIRVFSAVQSAVNAIKVAISWRDPASSPVSDVGSAGLGIYLECGLTPNVMVLGETASAVLKDRFRNLFSGQVPWTVFLANLFDVEKCIVADTAYNSAAEGQPIQLTEVFADSVILAHVDFTDDMLAPSLGRTMMWTGTEPNPRRVQPPGEAPRGIDPKLWGETLQQAPDVEFPQGIIVETYRHVKAESHVIRVMQPVAEFISAPLAGVRLYGTTA